MPVQRFYEALQKEGANFEVVFVSRDREADDLLEYYEDHQGPWYYLEFGNEWIPKLLEQFEVKTIPALRLIRPDGTVVVMDARTEVQVSAFAFMNIWGLGEGCGGCCRFVEELARGLQWNGLPHRHLNTPSVLSSPYGCNLFSHVL